MDLKRLRSVVAILLIGVGQAHAAGWTLVGWNNLGMHCMDSDYSVFSILPPYNTIHAQLIDPQGQFVSDPAGITVTYEAVADPSGSITTTSAAKTNFWDHVLALFGVSLPTESGLAGKNMPGPLNTPQPLSFDGTSGWFVAEGIPITPYDDMRLKNPYPMMRLVARDASGNVLATTDIVLPVSDEMSCLTCHASGTGAAAQPAAGWAYDSNPERDTRRNILRLHDERQAGDNRFAAALAANGYNPAGLHETAVGDGRAVLCASCHASAALGTSGFPGTVAFTQAMHGRHAGVIDPKTGTSLDSSDNRAACYSCHPGSTTRCLRGAMGAAVAGDGTLAIQCQGCHGSMSVVANPGRTGWLDEPTCQSCHTGTAVNNNGQLRYTSAFDSPGHARVAVDSTFATSPNVPAAGLSLYRFSTGHGGIKCQACHGSTHAEFLSIHSNDNIYSIQHQGHVGVLTECTSCHASQPQTVTGGPHGMHPVGQAWVSRHADVVGDDGSGAAPCKACHGADYRGTVLSRSQADRLLNTEDFGSKYFWRGFQIGCYACHFGPNGEERNPNHAPQVEDATLSIAAGTISAVALSARDTDHNALTLRIVTQPSNGTATITAATATYFPAAGFVGGDSFTFAASDGYTDSNLGTVSISVLAGGTCPPAVCGHGMVDAYNGLIKNMTTCHDKLASMAFKGQPFDEEACEHGDPSRSALAKYDKAISRLAASCPAQTTINANAIRASLFDGSQSLDAQNAAIYCDSSSGRPLDIADPDEGFVPATEANLHCAQAVAKYIKRLTMSVLSCQRRWADARTKGRSFDFAACQNAAIAKSTATRDKLLATGDCAACLGQSGQDNLRNTLIAQLTASRSLIFICPASP